MDQKDIDIKVRVVSKEDGVYLNFELCNKNKNEVLEFFDFKAYLIGGFSFNEGEMFEIQSNARQQSRKHNAPIAIGEATYITDYELLSRKWNKYIDGIVWDGIIINAVDDIKVSSEIINTGRVIRVDFSCPGIPLISKYFEPGKKIGLNQLLKEIDKGKAEALLVNYW